MRGCKAESDGEVVDGADSLEVMRGHEIANGGHRAGYCENPSQ